MSKKINPDAPAFPIQEMGVAYIAGKKWISTGMSLRQYYSGLAMQGLCANSVPGQHHQFEFLAKEAVMYADALINELNK